MKYLIYTVLVIVFSLISLFFYVKVSTGMPGYTGSPGELTCNSCHSGGNGTTSVSISSTPSFSNNLFEPGMTYTINVMVSNSNYSRFGFGCEILNEDTFTNAGVISLISSSSDVQLLNAPNGRKNAVHVSPKVGSGSTIFSFEWTAPTSTNNIVIYAAGNAVNGNGNTTGDAVGTTSLSLSASISSINEITNNVKMNIYPNPASEFVSIQIENVTEKIENVNLELWDLKGNKIVTLSSIKLIDNGTQRFRLFLPENLNSGLYILKLQSLNNQNITSKMIIIKK